MNVIDALLALVILLSIAVGWRRGFLLSSLQLLTLAGSLLLAFLGYRRVAAPLQSHLPSLGVWILPVSFLATYVIAQIVLGLVARAIAHAIPLHVHVHPANKALGVVPGLANGLINVTVLSVILVAVPLFDRLSELARDSEIATRLSPPAQWFEAKLAPIFQPAVRRTLHGLTVNPESRELVRLRFKVADPKVRADLEVRMLDMVNAERAKQGLTPLQIDPELTEVARAHSRDMLARGYFSHVAPDGQDPFDRMRKAHVHYLAAGENLAFAPTLAAAHQGLMNSPGHRANMLRPQFGHIGVGVLDAGRYGLMVTQTFRN